MIRSGSGFIAGAALLLCVADSAFAQSESQGRTVFREAGCIVCHAYVAKIGAPSAKQMKGSFRGNPAGIQKGIENAPTHATDATVKAASRDQVRQITEWLSGAWSGAAVVSIPSAKVAAAPVPVPAKPAEETPKQKKERLEAEAKAKREAEALARLERAEKARKDAEARVALKREADEKARLAASDRDKRAADERAALKREAEEKSKRVSEGKARRDAELQAVQKRESEDLARRVADAKAKNDVEAQARLKREAEEKSRLAEAAKVKAEADERAAKRKAADELAQREAELRARREVEEQAALKREAEERARRETELAKREAEAKAKARRDAELATAVAAKAAQPVVVASVKPDRSQLKAPEKFRDDPCPPPSGAPIIVDEARAKAIMDRIDCTGCHAYVQKKTGPPFKKVFEKVKGNPECVLERLKKNKEHNEEGVTDELTGLEFKIVADYVATRAK